MSKATGQTTASLSKARKFVTMAMRDYETCILSQFYEVYKAAHSARLKNLDPEPTPEQTIIYDTPGRLTTILRNTTFMKDLDLTPVINYKKYISTVDNLLSKNATILNNIEQIQQLISTSITYITRATSRQTANSFIITQHTGNDEKTHMVLLIKRGATVVGPRKLLFMLLLIDHILALRGETQYNIYSAHPTLPYYFGSALEKYHITSHHILRVHNLLMEFLNHMHYEIIDYATYLSMKKDKWNYHPPYTTVKLLLYILSYPDKLKVLQLFNQKDIRWLDTMHLPPVQNTQEGAGLHIPLLIQNFHLKIDRTPNTGIGTIGIHPVVFELLDRRITCGVQVLVNDKRYTLTSTSLAKPPLAKLRSKSIVQLKDTDTLKQVKHQIEYLTSWGEAIFSPEDFPQENQNSLYTRLKWMEDLSNKITDRTTETGIYPDELKNFSLFANNLYIEPTAEQTTHASELLGIPLHPSFHYGLGFLSSQEILALQTNSSVDSLNVKIEISSNKLTDQIVEKLLIPTTFDPSRNVYIVEGDPAKIFNFILQRCKINDFHVISNICPRSIVPIQLHIINQETNQQNTQPQAHVIFPVGSYVQNNDIISSYSLPFRMPICKRLCNVCSFVSPYKICPICDSETTQLYYCQTCKTSSTSPTCNKCNSSCVSYDNNYVDIEKIIDHAVKKVGIRPYAPLRGITQATGPFKEVERIEKGILRQKHNLNVFKDGSVRFTITNAPLTTFTPKLVNASVGRLKELGYLTDINNKELRSEEQIIYLKPQDVILSFKAADHLRRVCDFLDEELSSLYSVTPFYNIKDQSDLIGHLIVSINENNDFALVGRIIGFTESPLCLAHPVWHLSKQSRCSGVADQITMLLDALLNFSSHYFSPLNSKGTISSIQPILDPEEYFQFTNNIAITSSSIRSRTIRLKTEDYIFKMYSSSQHLPTICSQNHSSYYDLSHLDQIKLQIQINEYSSTPNEILDNTIKTTVIPTILYTISRYTKQQFKCKNCNKVYRRQTYSGTCIVCGKQLQPTVTLQETEILSNYISNITENIMINQATKEAFNVAANALQLTKYGKKQATLSDFT